jgi:uncharacterized protein (TIGR02996 family)
MRTFVYSDDRSHKFWNIELKGRSFSVTFGRQGTAGQMQTKDFADEVKARKEHDKLVAEKLAKGYRETTPAASAPTSLREALESALVANPDDLASHMADADYLTEQGDPRGDLIRVQLALEDTSKPASARKKLQEQEKALLDAHAREWLGGLAPFLLGDEDVRENAPDLDVEYSFARGWLDSLDVFDFSVAFARALAEAPQARLLRHLVLAEPSWDDPEADEAPAGVDNPHLHPLFRSPHLGNVRVLQIGPDNDQCHTRGRGVPGLVKLMPRLEELHLFAHRVDADQLFALKTLNSLRVLRVYHNDSYPLEKLAKNPSLGRLTHLLCWPHAVEDYAEGAYIKLPAVRALVRSPGLPALTHLELRLSDLGDQGIREIVASGILKRLEFLDLSGGFVSDEGAHLLAACPDLRHLKELRLDRNCLTEAGVAALKATGVKLSAQSQWQPTGDDFHDSEYLFEGDIE